MKTIYLDLFSGISGDMFIGALLDLGVDAHQFEHELEKLGLCEGEYHLHVSRQERAHIAGTKFDVHLAHDHHEDKPHEHEHEHAHAHGHSHAHHHGHSHDEHSAESHSHEHSHGRNFAEIKSLILSSRLSDWVKQKSVAIF